MESVAIKDQGLLIAVTFPEIDGYTMKDLLDDNAGNIEVYYYINNFTNKKKADTLHYVNDSLYYIAVDTSDLDIGALMTEVRAKIPDNAFTSKYRLEIARCNTGVLITK